MDPRSSSLRTRASERWPRGGYRVRSRPLARLNGQRTRSKEGPACSARRTSAPTVCARTLQPFAPVPSRIATPHPATRARTSARSARPRTSTSPSGAETTGACVSELKGSAAAGVTVSSRRHHEPFRRRSPRPLRSDLPARRGGHGRGLPGQGTRLDREGALKVRPEPLSGSEDCLPLRARGHAISSLQHPHICTLYDVGRQGETDFLVMELLEGGRSRSAAARAAPHGGFLRWGPDRRALETAHTAGSPSRPQAGECVPDRAPA